MQRTIHRSPGAVMSAVLVCTVAAAQDASLSGRWAAREADRGVVVTLTFGSSNTLVIPGTGPSGRTTALTLAVKNLQRTQRTATFTVELPDNEGAIDFDFSLSPNDDSGSLRVRRINGEPPDDDLPSWTLTRSRQG